MTAVSARRTRFTTLDAMRGVAALAVVILHYSMWIGGYRPYSAPLAVDAFFLLSGFVLAFRYDPDFASGRHTLKSFMIARAKRLLPIYLIGLTLGLVAQVVTHESGLSGLRLFEAAGVNAVGLPALTLVGPDSSFFPTNYPFWSLFFEFWVANFAYGALWRWLRPPALLTIVCLAAITIVLGKLSLVGGFTPRELPVGVARVAVSFFGGVALARVYASRPPPIRIPSFAILAALAVVLLAPLSPRYLQMAAIFIAFPLLTYFATTASHMPAKVGAMLGDASYAAYAVHVPALLLLRGPLQALTRTYGALTEAVFLLTIAAASVGLARLDVQLRGVPFRRWPRAGVASVQAAFGLVARS